MEEQVGEGVEVFADGFPGLVDDRVEVLPEEGE
jgi:hypothetical protein